MHIGILSRNPALYSTSRLKEAAEDYGHQATVVDYSRCHITISSENPTVLMGDQALRFDAIIPRIGASRTFYGTAVVRQFEAMKVFATNSAAAILRSRDKLCAMQLLSTRGVGLPVTGFARDTNDVEALIKAVGGPPLIIKLLEGTQGVGVVLTETKKAAESVIAAFNQLDANILVQEFIKEAEGADIRAFVIGNRVVAAMRRQGPEGDFRSNLHRGGHATPIKLTPAERHAAVEAAKIMGLGVAGVDMLRANRGPVVIEVNSSPGLEGIEETTDIDVAGKIIEYIQDHVSQGHSHRAAKNSGSL